MIEEHPEGIPPDAAHGTTWVSCPLDGCVWALHVEEPLVDPNKDISVSLAMGVAPGFFARQAMQNHFEEVEEVLSKHLATHTMVEALQTIQRLRGELLTARDGIEPPPGFRRTG